MKNDFDDALSLARYLYDRAESVLEEQNSYSIGLAVSLAQDAVETMLFVIARRVNAQVTGNITFDKLWSSINAAMGEDLPMSAAMASLNKGRVNFKHHGLIPDETSARRLIVSAYEFLTQSCASFIDLAWSEVSLADAVKDDSIRKHIKHAEKALNEQDVLVCLDSCALAHGEIKMALDQHLPRIPAGIGFHSGTPQDAVLQTLLNVTDRLTIQLGRASLGINLADAHRFASIAPVALTSPLSENTQFIDTGDPNLSIQDAQFCVRYVTDMAIRLERRWAVPRTENDYR